MKTYATGNKAASRDETVVSIYRKAFDVEALPAGKQFWTLCARDDELLHLTSDGFLTEHQYHGIDFSQENIDANRAGHPDANWHCGDFYTVLSNQVGAPGFNPAIVNFDSTWMDRAITETIRLLALLESQENLMLVSNIVGKTRGYSLDPDEMDLRLTDSRGWERAQALGWDKHPEWYVYKGGAANTTMQTHIFYRR